MYCTCIHPKEGQEILKEEYHEPIPMVQILNILSNTLVFNEAIPDTIDLVTQTERYGIFSETDNVKIYNL